MGKSADELIAEQANQKDAFKAPETTPEKPPDAEETTE